MWPFLCQPNEPKIDKTQVNVPKLHLNSLKKYSLISWDRSTNYFFSLRKVQSDFSIQHKKCNWLPLLLLLLHFLPLQSHFYTFMHWLCNKNFDLSTHHHLFPLYFELLFSWLTPIFGKEKRELNLLQMGNLETIFFINKTGIKLLLGSNGELNLKLKRITWKEMW